MGLLLKNILAAVFLLALSQSLLLHWLGSKRRHQRPKSRFFHMEMAFFDGNKLLQRLAKHGCLVLATAPASLVKVPKKVFFSFVHYQYLLQQSSKTTLRMHRFFRHTLVVLDWSRTIKINLELISRCEYLNTYFISFEFHFLKPLSFNGHLHWSKTHRVFEFLFALSLEFFLSTKVTLMPLKCQQCTFATLPY